MRETRVRDIERRIGRINEALATIGLRRPGSRTRQDTDLKGGSGSSWPISSPRAMKRHTEDVGQDGVADIRRQIPAYQRFTTRTAQGIDVGLAAWTGTRPLATPVGSA